MPEHPKGRAGASEEPVLVRREGSVLVLTLNRPDRLNAVSLPMYERLRAELRGSAADRDVRCVVLTGQGRAFCVGADLKAHGVGPPTGEERKRYVRTAQEVNHLIQTGPKPVVAAVNGHAIGGGLEMALSSDFMVVADEAKLRFPEISLGTFIGGGTVYSLAERVGTLKARELVYLGDFFLGREAATMGVAWKAVPADKVLEEAMTLAGRLAEKAPISMAWAKRLIGPAGTMPREQALGLEAEALEQIFGTRDWKEGVEAFHEKRTPRYTGE
ncbi:MAG: enoyl-CoA hydratase/isomerase family protein [Longimicrobiales bacterium]|nr:enoyl-CoA hydratase/isomerase family protein [Longimicrobiales bacterium]